MIAASVVSRCANDCRGDGAQSIIAAHPATVTALINFDALQLRYQPFPIGSIRPAFSDQLYNECTAAFPPVELFERIDKVGLKYALSEKYAPKNYHSLIRTTAVWRRLHAWIKSDTFIDAALNALRTRGVNVGYHEPHISALRRIKRAARRRSLARSSTLTTRFQFSMLPANGGHILPHTDSPEKIVTLVVSMCRDGEWNESYGGGTDIVMPKNEEHLFDRLNDRDLGFTDVERLDTYPYLPNQVLMFVKTFNSWHSVEPMQGPDGLMRKTLTINIEAR
jgi:hypothetical protein